MPRKQSARISSLAELDQVDLERRDSDVPGIPGASLERSEGFCPIQFGLIHCIKWFHCKVNFTCPDLRNSRLGRAEPDSDRAFEMGKRKSVATKKAWSKLDTSELEVAAQDKNRELLRSADPEHKKVTASPHAMEAARKAAWRMEVPWAGFPIDHIGPEMTSRRGCPIRGSRCCGDLACCSKGFQAAPHSIQLHTRLG